MASRFAATADDESATDPNLKLLTLQLLELSPTPSELAARPLTVEDIDQLIDSVEGVFAPQRQSKKPGQLVKHDLGGLASGTPVLVGQSRVAITGGGWVDMHVYALVVTGSWEGQGKKGSCRRFSVLLYPGPDLAERVRDHKNVSKQRKNAVRLAAARQEGQQQARQQQQVQQQVRQQSAQRQGQRQEIPGFKQWEKTVPEAWTGDASFYVYNYQTVKR